MKKILCINTYGTLGRLRACRLTAMLDPSKFETTHCDVDKSISRRCAAAAVWRQIKAGSWDLLYMEGSGIAGGFNLIRAARAWEQPYIVSSGDPIGGFFRTTQGRMAGQIFEIYEQLLYRHCAGFIGWTPYLTGVAVKMGAGRAVTIEGAVDLNIFQPLPVPERLAAKQAFGLNPDHLICGVVGSMNWSARQSYCYGLELVKTLPLVQRKDVSVLLVGDGSGKSVLERRVPAALRDRIIFTGRLPETQVAEAMNAMDIGFITQTLDSLGSFRLTTKLPEYLASGLPVAMSPIPGFYDYASRAGWPLPPFHPASAKFHAACATWLDHLRWEDVHQKAAQARPVAIERFDYNIIGARFRQFVEDLPL